MAAPNGNKNALGHKLSLESKEKMRQARLKNPVKYWLGKKRSDEDKLKMSKGQIGRTAYNKGKKLPHLWGEKNKLWKGGTPGNHGYLSVCVGGRHILAHRYEMEKFLGRELLSTEEVHHKNGDRHDNRIENLEVIERREHRRMHIFI